MESAIRKYGDKDIRWSSQGMLRLMPEAMQRLFMPTLEKIKAAIGDVLNNPYVKGASSITHTLKVRSTSLKVFISVEQRL